MPIIEADGLTKTYRVFQKKEGLLGALRGLFRREYKEVQAVDGVSFTIEPGEMVAFLGPNGAGKTTTLKMLSGLIYPTSRHGAGARLRPLGAAPTPSAAGSPWSWARRTSSGGTCPPPTASSSTARSTRSRRPTSSTTLGELTELFGVEKLTRQPVRELSLGERMKMELIAALLHQPQLLLLDEPTIGLDVVAQVTIQKCLREYNARRGVTMLLTSHYMRDVEALCSRVLVITHGQLVYDGAAGGHHRAVRPAPSWSSCSSPTATRPTDLERFGEVTAARGRSADLKVDRGAGGRGAGGDPRPLHGRRHERAGPAAGPGDRPRLRGGPHDHDAA